MIWKTALGIVLALGAVADRYLYHRQPSHGPAGKVVRDGDIIFQMSDSQQSEAISLATHSKFTHVGIIFLRDGDPWVLEAVQPVKWTPLDPWIAHGIGHHAWVKRLHDAKPLDKPAIEAMRTLGESWLGRDYDLQFRWSDDRLYCSELVYKLYDRGAHLPLGKVQQAGELDLSNPIVQAKVKERFGEAFDPKEPVISPHALYDDPRLDLVYEQ